MTTHNWGLSMLLLNLKNWHCLSFYSYLKSKEKLVLIFYIPITQTFSVYSALVQPKGFFQGSPHRSKRSDCINVLKNISKPNLTKEGPEFCTSPNDTTTQLSNYIHNEKTKSAYLQPQQCYCMHLNVCWCYNDHNPH